MTDQQSQAQSQQAQAAAASQFSNYSQGGAGSSPQILDLTRQEAKKEVSKQEQTEPVDFSSNTSAYTYTTTSASTMVAGSFSTTESGNSATTDTLNRYRSNAVPGTFEWIFASLSAPDVFSFLRLLHTGIDFPTLNLHQLLVRLCLISADRLHRLLQYLWHESCDWVRPGSPEFLRICLWAHRSRGRHLSLLRWQPWLAPEARPFAFSFKVIVSTLSILA